VTSPRLCAQKVHEKVSPGLGVAAHTSENGPSGAATRERKHIINTTHNTKTKLLATAVGLAAAAVATPALLFAGGGTAQANANAFPSDASECNFADGMGGFLQCKQNDAIYGPGWQQQPANYLPLPQITDTVDTPSYRSSNPNAPAPSTMSTWDGTMGSGPQAYPEPHEAPEPIWEYNPEVVAGD
jgi:hypothetical protein